MPNFVASHDVQFTSLPMEKEIIYINLFLTSFFESLDATEVVLSKSSPFQKKGRKYLILFW